MPGRIDKFTTFYFSLFHFIVDTFYLKKKKKSTEFPVIEDFKKYLEKRFDFEQVTVKKFRTWAERRQFNREMKRKQAEAERPILPANQKLITLSVQDAPTKKGNRNVYNFH